MKNKQEEEARASESERDDSELTYSSQDIKDLKIGHSLADVMDQENGVLVLKDSNVLDDEEEDELIDVSIQEKAKIEKNLSNRRKRKYTGYEEEDGNILQQYDEVTGEVKKDSFRVDELSKASVSRSEQQAESLKESVPLEMSDFYTQEELSAFKKPRKRGKIRKKEIDDEPIVLPKFIPQSSATINLNDDLDLQNALTKTRKAAVKKIKIEDIAHEIEKEKNKSAIDQGGDSGITIYDTEDMLSNVGIHASKIADQERTEMIETGKKEEDIEEPISLDTKHSISNENVVAGFQPDEPLVRDGIGATIALLSQRGMWTNTSKSASDTEAGNEYRPSFVLEHKDEFGRVMNPKEAFKQLSWRFHGQKPGKKKTEKRIKKIQAEMKMDSVGVGK